MQSAAAAGPRLRIGAILPLTGPVADYGTAIRNSIQLAQADNAEAFKHIEILYEDAAYDARQAVNAFKKLTAQDKVDLIYTWGVSFCQALAPLAESNRIPLVAQCIDPSIGRGRRYVLRFMNYSDEYMAETLRFAESNGWKKLAVVLTNTGYLEELLAAVQRNLKAGQTVTVVDQYDQQNMDVRTTVSKLKRSGADAVGVFTASGQISQFYIQARQQELPIPTFGTNYFESRSEILLSGGSMNGAVFANNEVKADYAARYKAAFGNESQLGFGALAYEFAALSAEVFGKDGPKLSGEELLSALSSVKDRPGIAAGPYSYSEVEAVGRFIKFPVVMKRINGDNIEVIR